MTADAGLLKEAIPHRPKTLRAALLLGAVDVEDATGIVGAKWEKYQVDLWNDDARFGIDNKGRQSGYSFSIAAEALAESMLHSRSTNVFVSYNQTECTEKIRYAKAIWEALHPKARVPITNDARTYLEFENGSRLISWPGRPPRGKGPANIYLDELSHCQYDRDIYTAGIHFIQRGGRLRIGSTPLGESGMFWEILTQAFQPYPGFSRRTIPWWTIEYLCTDVPRAVVEAPHMETRDRVYEFGTEILIDIFEQKPIESFQEEMECLFLDETVAWITWDEIRACQQKPTETGAPEWPYWTAENVEQAKAAVDELAHAVGTGNVSKELFAGVDIGRTKDLTEIHILDRRATTPRTTQRMMISLRATEFAQQREVLYHAMDKLPIKQCLIDSTGLGMQLAEEAHKKWPGRCKGVTFTMQSKQQMAVTLKVAMQRVDVILIADRDLAYQIHSVKRKVTAANNIVFDVDASEKHHADRFWAVALGVLASGIVRLKGGGFDAIRLGGARGQEADAKWKSEQDAGFIGWKTEQEMLKRLRTGQKVIKEEGKPESEMTTAEKIHRQEVADHLGKLIRR